MRAPSMTNAAATRKCRTIAVFTALALVSRLSAIGSTDTLSVARLNTRSSCASAMTISGIHEARASASASAAAAEAEAEARASWMPLIVIALAQLLLVFNLATLKVSVDPIADSLDTSASAVKTAIVLHFLVAAAFVMLGARIAQRFGGRRVFRATAATTGAAMVLMAAARDARAVMI